MIITLDGPAGVGKSSLSQDLGKALNFAVLDTGALYRGIALAALGQDLPAEERLDAWLASIDLKIYIKDRNFIILLAGQDIEPLIRNDEIADLASRLSALKAVRGFLLDLQRQAGRQGNLVAEGRDMGTVVFPQAEVKFFITASPQIRAQRRLRDLLPQNPDLTLSQVLADMKVRDERDQNRNLAPLAPAADAMIVDSTNMNRERTLDVLLAAVKEKMKN